MRTLLQAKTTATGRVLPTLHGPASRRLRTILVVALVALNGAMVVLDSVGAVLNLAVASGVYLLQQPRGGST